MKPWFSPSTSLLWRAWVGIVVVLFALTGLETGFAPPQGIEQVALLAPISLLMAIGLGWGTPGVALWLGD